MNFISKATLIALTFVLICSCGVQAVNLPDGYNGVKWKTTFSDFLSKVDVFPLSTYLSPNKILSVTEVAPDNDKRGNIFYRFYKDRLLQVNITFKRGGMISDEESKMIIDETEKLYGKPIEYRKPYFDERGGFIRTLWRDDKTQISYDEFRFKKGTIRSSLLSYSSNELMAEYLRDTKPGVNIKGN